jgi:hypothetical protein
LLLAATLDRVAQDLRNRVEFSSRQTGGQCRERSRKLTAASVSENSVSLKWFEFLGESFGSFPPYRRDSTA